MKKHFWKLLIGIIIILGIILIPQVAHNDVVTPTDLNPDSGSITLTKIVNGQLWRIRCDYMDGNYTQIAGGGIWKRDWIMNPEGNTSAEGHRSHKCGDAEHWVIWTDLNGAPYRMDEIKSGSTGGTLPTVIYKTHYEMSTAEIMDIGNPDHPEYLEHFKSNFQETMDYSEIQIGKRLYWITWNGDQKWYHTGIPYEVTQPSFVISIDGHQYLLSSGDTVELTDLEPGIHTISEVENPLYSLGKVIVSDGGTIITEDGWTITINIRAGENIEVEWPNQQPGPVKTSPPPPPPTTAEPTATPTPTPTPTPSPTPVIDIEGYKIWDDEDNLYEARPDYITINLYANGSLAYSIKVYAKENDVHQSMWSYKFEGIPEVDENGEKINYTIDEDPVEGYEVNYRKLNIFNCYITPTPSPTPTATPTHSPTPAPSPTPTFSPTPIPSSTPALTPKPTSPLHIPTIPTDQPQPHAPKPPYKMIEIDEYSTALGGQLLINHVGDCFE